MIYRVLAVLPRSFYEDDPARAALGLLGAVLARRLEGLSLRCRVTEVEAYYGPEDPASRARRWGGIRARLSGGVGEALVYGMHRQWLLNIVAHPPGGSGAVLIRACEPLTQLPPGAPEPVGPGRLTRALMIDKSLDKVKVYLEASPLVIEPGEPLGPEEIASSHRVGVREDLEEHLRFYVKNSYYVSRPRSPKPQLLQRARKLLRE